MDVHLEFILNNLSVQKYLNKEAIKTGGSALVADVSKPKSRPESKHLYLRKRNLKATNHAQPTMLSTA